MGKWNVCGGNVDKVTGSMECMWWKCRYSNREYGMYVVEM